MPKFLKRGKSPEEALSMAKEMCKNVPNLYNECVDLAELHYNSIERDMSMGGASGPVGGAGSSSETYKKVQNAPVGKENYRSSKKSNILLHMIIFFVIIMIILYFLAPCKI